MAAVNMFKKAASVRAGVEKTPALIFSHIKGVCCNEIQKNQVNVIGYMLKHMYGGLSCGVWKYGQYAG